MEENKIENGFGTLYLSKERAEEYQEIVNKHLRSLLYECREHNLIPTFVSLEKTSVWEYKDIISMQQCPKLKNKNS